MKIYIIAGKAGSGKDTLALILKEKLNGKTIIISYASYLKIYAKNVLGWDGDSSTKPRTFLQELGDIVKDIDPNFLVNRVLEDIEVYSHYFDNIIISDARFIPEIKTVEDKFGAVKILIHGRDNNLSDTEKKHNTETSLDGFDDFDYVIDNSGTLDDLKNKADEILEALK